MTSFARQLPADGHCHVGLDRLAILHRWPKPYPRSPHKLEASFINPRKIGAVSDYRVGDLAVRTHRQLYCANTFFTGAFRGIRVVVIAIRERVFGIGGWRAMRMLRNRCRRRRDLLYLSRLRDSRGLLHRRLDVD